MNVFSEVGSNATSLSRAAFYGRSASYETNATALNAQLLSCLTFAESAGMSVVNEHLFMDNGESGLRTEGRNGLAALLRTAEQRPKPFRWVLVANTARIAQEPDLVLDFTATLKSHGIDVHFVDDRLESSSPQFALLVTLGAIVCEVYRDRLSCLLATGATMQSAIDELFS